MGKWHCVWLARVKSGRHCSKHSSITTPHFPASPAIIPAILPPPKFQQGGANYLSENLLETKGWRDKERRRKGDWGGASLKAFLWCQSSTSSKTRVKHACKHMHLGGGLMSDLGIWHLSICASVLLVHCITPPRSKRHQISSLTAAKRQQAYKVWQ